MAPGGAGTVGGVKLELEGTLALVTLSRPPVNAIDEDWLARLDEMLGTVEASAAAVLLVRSSERIFSAGADLALMRSRMGDASGRAAMVAFVRDIQRVYARLERLPQVSIAEIAGAALGGGLELALACDLRIAATDARLGLPEARLGLLPGAGGTQRLTRIAGEATARRLILGAEIIKGNEALALGLVQWAVGAEALPARARAIAEDIAALPAATLAHCKRCIGAAVARDPQGYELEMAATAELLAKDQTRERVLRFLEKER
jgi:enoyl-CoA hydratase